MRNVAKRMRNCELSQALVVWHKACGQARAKRKAEQVMRRVGARMCKRELALNWAEWYRNYSQEMVGMWQSKAKRLQSQLATVQRKLDAVTAHWITL